MAPNTETEDIITMTSNLSKVYSLKAAIFHTMAYKLSLEINKKKITPKSLIAFLKVLYQVTQIKKKKITFEQYSRIHLDNPKIALCETASNVVFVLNTSFTTKDHYFRVALQEATDAFISMLQNFGYTPKIRNLRSASTSSSSTATTSFNVINKILTFSHSSSTSLHFFILPR